MAAPPSTASPASWKPAVPPPPVTGASVGNWLNEGLGGGLAEGSGLSLVDSAGLSEEPGLSLAEVLLLLAVLVAEEVAPLAAGENTDVGVVGDDVQAESATQPSMIVRPQPTAVSLTRCAVHAMAVRVFIEPPHALGNDHFPVADRRNRRRNGNRVAGLWSLTAPAGQNAGDLNGKPRLRHKHAMARRLSEY